MATRPPYRAGSGLRINRDGLQDLKDAVFDLTKQEVLVGFPEETTDRKPDGTMPTGITNASLAYIHDNGQPEQNIPARPFMFPGIADAEERVANKMEQVAKAQVAGRNVLQQGLTQIGLIVQTSIRKKINEGLPPPLSDATLRDRLRRHKGRKGETQELANRAAGMAPGTTLAKPLIDTGQLRNAVNYVIRPKKRR